MSSIAASSAKSVSSGLLSTIVRALVSRLPSQDATAILLEHAAIPPTSNNVAQHSNETPTLADEQQLLNKIENLECKLKQAEHEIASKGQKLAYNMEQVELLKSKTMAASTKVSHPVYGSLLKDFGYKRVYSTPVSKLCSSEHLPVWEKQRVFRRERAQAIAADKKKDMQFGFPGVISVFEDKSSNIRGILDGQHRVASVDILVKENAWDSSKEVLLEVFPDCDDSAAGRLFREINQAQPIQAIDMPGVIGENEKHAIDSSCQQLLEKYPKMFSNSLKCRVPRVNVDTLRENLFESPFARMHTSSQDELLSWMERCNEKLSQRSKRYWTEEEKRTRLRLVNALPLAKQHNFFLGMTKDWLEQDILK